MKAPAAIRSVARFALIAVGVGAAIACGDARRASSDLAATCAAIDSANAVFTKAHVQGDIPTIDAMFARDAQSFPPGAPPVVGPAALHQLTVDYLAAGIHAFTETQTGCYGSEDLVVDQGNYEVVYGDDSTVERGKYLNVWAREDGALRIRANIWNTSAP